MSAKSDLKSAALICGTAVDAFDVVLVEEVVVDELHAEAETTSPKESNAPVNATDFRAVPIDLPSVGDSPIRPWLVSLHRRVHPQPHWCVVIEL
jgi:hypothetical protein